METSTPYQFNLKKASKDATKTIRHQANEDEKIAGLSSDERWEALRDRIERKMKAANSSATIDQSTIGLVENMEEYGFKCALRDLLVEAYQGIIDDVENTAKFLKQKDNEQGTKK